MPSYTAAVSIDTDQDLDSLDLGLIEREISACLAHLGVVAVNVDWAEDEVVSDGVENNDDADLDDPPSDDDPSDPDDDIDLSNAVNRPPST